MDLSAVQAALRAAGIDGWLFYDFDNRDPIAYRILKLPQKHASRRWYYLVPAEGDPLRLVHAVEATRLDDLPGRKVVYLPWQQMRNALREAMTGLSTVAMQYSPECAIPYLSRVDAGTVELIRSFGVEVVSSADLVQHFEALLTPAAYATHCSAGDRIHAILESAWQEVAKRVREGKPATEHEIQQFIVEGFRGSGLEWDDHAPIVAVGAHAGDPHFEPTAENSVPIIPGSPLLIDLWAKLNKPGAIYYDITWCAFVGDGKIPAKYEEIFRIAREARDRALAFIEERLQKDEPLYGYEVDRACRGHIEQRGYGKYFIHRTGHSIGEQVHGNGANIDDLETRDQRALIPGCLFSIEPGIYMGEEEGLGVRTEIDAFIDESKQLKVYGPVQKELVRITP